MKVKEFIEYLSKFNQEATIYGNVSGNPFDIDLNKHIAWCSIKKKNIRNNSVENKYNKCTEVFIDFTYPELAK